MQERNKEHGKPSGQNSIIHTDVPVGISLIIVPYSNGKGKVVYSCSW